MRLFSPAMRLLMSGGRNTHCNRERAGVFDQKRMFRRVVDMGFLMSRLRRGGQQKQAGKRHKQDISVHDSTAAQR